MNSSFVVDDVETTVCSRRDLCIIFVAGIGSAILGLFLADPMTSSFDLTILLNSVRIVSMTFATGLFIFLTAGLLFSSHASRLYLLRKIDEVGAKRAFQIRILHTIVITGVFTLVLTIIAFLKPIILGRYPMSLDHFAFFPAVLGASLIVSAILASLASSLATITDDSRLCTVLGSASTLVIALVAGWSSNPRPYNYSITRNIALLSPHNIVRALTVQLSGYQFESTNDMVRYVGFVVSVEGLAISLLLLGSVLIVLFLTGQRALAKNSTRWPVLKGMIPVIESWDASDSAEKLQEINRTRRGLRLQRGLTTMIVGVLLLSMFAGGSTYRTYMVNRTTIVHYETPGIREDIPVGSWIVFDVDVHPPYPGLFNILFFHIDIETLGNTSGTVSLYFGILEMDSAEFDLLEESIRFESLSSWFNQSYGVGVGQGQELEESYGSYICALKIISDVAPSEKSYIEGTLQIIQEAY